jgi:D-Ala-D-Ala carboxypeptidase 3 (S13) family
MKHFTPEEYQTVKIVRPMAVRRKRPIAPGSTKLIVGGTKIPFSYYVNVGLGLTFTILLLRTFLPDMNPFATVEENIVATFSDIRGTTVTFDWKTLADPQKIQNAMKGIPGSFVVADSEGQTLASTRGDVMMSSASVAKTYTTVAMLEKFPDKYFKSENFERLAEAYEVSDNYYFDNKADEVGGVNYIQTLMRKITGNNQITIANGSGCPRLTRGTGVHNCSGHYKGATEPTKMSANDTIKVLFYLENQLNKRSKKFSDLAPQKNGSRRYGSGFNRPVFAKTGTINELYSLMGVVNGPNGEKVAFAAFTPGDGDRPSVHIKVLNSVFPR